MIALLDPPASQRQTAILLGITPRHVRRLLASGVLHVAILDGRRAVDFDSLAEYVATHGTDTESHLTAYLRGLTT